MGREADTRGEAVDEYGMFDFVWILNNLGELHR
jgi:hypothetical protein